MHCYRWFMPLFVAGALGAQPAYDLLIQGGHVIDPKNGVNGVRDVAVAGGRIARVAAGIPASQARKRVNAAGLYVTPGIIDIHVHVYTGTGVAKVIAGDNSVYPDGFSFRTGVTTMVDAGTAGWRNFPDFRQRVIDRFRTRVLAFLNIVDGGMGPGNESDPARMDPEAAIRVARQHADVVVGMKIAHYHGDGWPDVDNAVKAARALDKPLMVDFGYIKGERNIGNLFRDKLRAGDIYTHCYGGHREEVVDGKLNTAMLDGRKRGIFFDLGHGGGSFYWNIAVPAFEAGFLPDSISTDLHTGSMNGGMKDMPNVMSKVLNMGVPLEKVIEMSTWTPAREIKRTDLGHLDVGAEADITVLRVEKGDFGFLDAAGARKPGARRIVAELTVRKGAVVWDLNGIAGQDWKTFPYRKREP